jgi:maltooligosyltrehalose trehalohydrolase
MTATELSAEKIAPPWRLDLGAILLDSGETRFRVWAPRAESVSVQLLGGETSRTLPLRADVDGYFAGTVGGARAGDCYFYRLADGTERPDPASRFQPQGVHGPSQIVDPRAFSWQDLGWQGLPLEECVIYELHVGTFTAEGTFAAAISRLDYLAELGVTAVELLGVVSLLDGLVALGVRLDHQLGLIEFACRCHVLLPVDRRGLADRVIEVFRRLAGVGTRGWGWAFVGDCVG